MVSLKTNSANALLSIAVDERLPPATSTQTRIRTESFSICDDFQPRLSHARLASLLSTTFSIFAFSLFPIPPTSHLFSITLYSRYPILILTALVSSLENNPLHSAVGILRSSSITTRGLALDVSWFQFSFSSPFLTSVLIFFPQGVVLISVTRSSSYLSILHPLSFLHLTYHVISFLCLLSSFSLCSLFNYHPLYLKFMFLVATGFCGFLRG